jgi:CHASE2 domain
VDGVVRQYRSSFPEVDVYGVDKAGKPTEFRDRHLETFERATVSKCLSATFCAGTLCKGQNCVAQTASDAEELPYISFGEVKSIRPIPASNFLDACVGNKNCRPTEAQQNTWKQLLQNRVVLIGGTYSQADRYVTPIGEMPGVELMARGIFAAANDQYIHPLAAWQVWVFHFALGAGLILLYFGARKSSLPWTFIVSVFGLVAPFVVALYAAHEDFWVGVAPIVASLIIERLLEREHESSTESTSARVLHIHEKTQEQAADGSTRITVRETDEADAENSKRRDLSQHRRDAS